MPKKSTKPAPKKQKAATSAATPLAINASPEIRTVAVSSLKPAPYNPRRIDPAALAGLEKSLERFGIVEPIIWNERTGYVVGGHQRLKVLRAKKVRETDVVVVDLEAIDEKALNLALNNPAIAGGFSDKLSALLAEIEQANGTIFADLRLDQLLAEAAAKQKAFIDRKDLNDIPPLPKNPITQLGDVWTLQRHRLVCGDSTDPAVLAELLRGELADLVFTDPPYGVKYDGGHAVKGKRRKQIAHDQDASIYGRALPLAYSSSSPTAPLYLWFSDSQSVTVIAAVVAAGYEIRNSIIWNKNQAQFGAIGAQYKSKHEPCLYAFKTAQKPFWDGPNNEVSVWDLDREKVNAFHPTQKPVELALRALGNSSPNGALVLDLFRGSGSTLIGCEASLRCARIAELDPAYCDVIVERWQTITGGKATRQTHDST